MSWETVKLAEVSEPPQYGAGARGTSEPVGPLFVRQTDIVAGRIDWESVPFCDLPEQDFEKYALSQGDLLISRLGNGVGNAVFVHEPNDAIFAGYLVRFKINPERADSRFVGYQLMSSGWWDHVASVRSGAAQPTLNAQQMAAFEFRLPPLPVQQEIAEILGVLDDKIKLNLHTANKISALLDLYALRFAQDSPRIPLGEIASINRTAVNPSSFETELVDHFSIPAFDAHTLPERVQAVEILSNKILVRTDSILLSRLNPRFNRTWFVIPSDVPALASTEFACLTPSGSLSLSGLWLSIRDPAFIEEMSNRVTGTSGSHQRIRPDDLLSVEVPDARGMSANLLALCQGLLYLSVSLRRESAQLAELRDALLPELLSGRMHVGGKSFD